MNLQIFVIVITIGLAYSSQKDYTYINYDSYMSLLERLKHSQLNQSIFRFTDGFENYSIQPRPKCGKNNHFTCRNPVFEIANFQKGNEFVQTLPTVLLIGGFHGDEVVGSNALFYLIDLIEKNHTKDPYLMLLLENVRILILPMANVNGFYFGEREETLKSGGKADPNRDFPFNLVGRGQCFRTSTALLIDAIFRRNLIVGCITFHGGDNSITFPWGSFSHKEQPKSADHIAFKSVAEMLKKAGSNNPGMSVQTYDIGTMHQVVYDVNGGFEDWAYGASVDRSNVNKDCGLYENPSHDLYKDSITYDQTSNRAFVFLIEAGHNKIPQEMFLGNELPLITRNQHKGKWGHVTRNINVALRFAETIRPHAVVTQISYNQVLMIELKVFGCLEINELLPSLSRLKITRRDKNELTNEWTLFVEFEISPGTTRSLSFDIVCDKHFERPTLNQLPISHFVKLRTARDFRINYQGNKLISTPLINVKILNIRTDSLNNAIIQWISGNINSITYSNTLRGAATDKSRPPEQIVHLTFNNGVVHTQTLASTQKKVQKDISVRKFGSMNPNWSFASPRHLMNFKSGQNTEMTSQTFLSIVGKDIDVYEENSNHILYTETIIMDTLNSYEQEMNALFIPPSGVNCRSEQSKSPFYFVEVTRPKDANLQFHLMTDSEEFYSFKTGNLKNDFELIESVNFEGRYLNRYQSQLTVPDFDDLRLLTRTFEVFKNKKGKVFECVLTFRDPDVGRDVQVEENDETIWIWQIEHNEKRNSCFILLLFVLFLIAIVVLGIRLRQRSFSEGSVNDLDKIIHSVNSNLAENA